MEGILIPQQVFVGDSAEFLFPIDALSSFDPSVLMSGAFRIETIKQNSFMDITSIQIKKQEKKEYISINFTPWETGSISFPSLHEAGINDAIPQVFISSILETAKVEVLQPPRPPLLIPGTSYLLYLIASVSGVLIFTSIMIISALRKHFFVYSFSRAQRIRIRTLNKSLRKLKRQLSSVSSSEGLEMITKKKDWLKKFEFVFRRYCFSLTSSEKELRSGDGDCMTYSEILESLKNRFENTYGVYFEFEKLFFKLQDLRFGNSDLTKINFEMETMYFLNQTIKLIKIAESEIQKVMNAKQKINTKTEAAVND
ncbi:MULTISPECIES: hypothetical protein [unclassified Treponema]|uniref:hypothetical protein n=1 Tax=unclassified Treponema TaxID=2638727 RepID=UPI0020A27A44|nr:MULTISPECIES: hypothetical protein [unclassified Treponema]UTC65846.1 hypothetical protein E4O06_07315 [Treponema sp. OMZ 789]UTC68574.1 hypothetical protein E4O01_07455 [Treponema sp. OMZ 790]UTC71304.1 hypothetical protein E4O02_07645 [Treponema sp. OMZ 791]